MLHFLASFILTSIYAPSARSGSVISTLRASPIPSAP